jgi:hypothetical protein
VDTLVEALAGPWARWWGSQSVGAAVAFWGVGLLAFLTWHPVRFRCAAADTGAWCRVHQTGAFGTGLALVLAAAVVAGSAVLVAALAPWLIRVLAGETWPYRRRGILPSRSLTRWLIRRQIDARGRVAAEGKPVSDIPSIASYTSPTTPPVPRSQPAARARRQHYHRVLADYAIDRAVDRRATARLRRYPADPGAIAPTRIGCALAAMTERVWRRHGLDLADCWEPLLVVCPEPARQLLVSESRRVAQRGQGMVWSMAAFAWTAVLPPAAAALWAAAVLVAVCLLHAGLREAVGTYCDLVEGTVATQRHLLYQAVGIPLPTDTSAERTVGRRLSAYLVGGPDPDQSLPLSWAALEPT